MNPGAPDCDFGPQTDAATIRFQRARGLLQDGIVGRNTWTSLQGELINSGLSDAYGTYWNDRADGLRFYYQFISNTWFVLDPYATPPGYRAMNALGTGGGLCP
ncbi:peptidoglycan-binding protein [Dactylosporangium matsuzakiense]|nr:peptidoglycan-binding protein [Dactylosporangium matsuzakiense]